MEKLLTTLLISLCCLFSGYVVLIIAWGFVSGWAIMFKKEEGVPASNPKNFKRLMVLHAPKFLKWVAIAIGLIAFALSVVRTK